MKKGFTLIEMLVVIGIIAVLSGSLLMGFNRVVKSARRAKAQEIVSNAATALAAILQKNGSWPRAILNEANGGQGRMTIAVAKACYKNGVLGVNCKDKENKDGTHTYTLMGTDRCGIVSPWAVTVLKAKDGAEGEGMELAVPGYKKGKKTVKDHQLYFAVDLDGDGITEASMEGKGNVRIRATAVVWCAGADGELDDYTKMGRTDDVYSWQKSQEDKSK